MIKVLHKENSALSTYTPEAFGQAMQILFSPKLAFADEKVLKKVKHQCKDAHENGLLEKRQKWLGALFSPEICTPTLPNLSIRWVSDAVGWGVFAETHILPFTFVGEYTGTVRKRKRWKDKKNNYCFDYAIEEGRKSSFVIDAEKEGNITRYINHSAKPNLEPVSVYCDGMIHIILLSTTHIPAGTQLTYDYGEKYWLKRRAPEVL